MPNHISNKLTIKGTEEEINKFLDFIKSDEEVDGERCHMDFNKIVPMPKELQTSESSSRVTNALICYAMLSDDPKVQAHLPQMIGMPFDPIKERVSEKSAEEKKELFELGKQYYGYYEKYGAIDWYQWSRMHWGTKWNAYSSHLATHGNYAELFFQTAWSGVSELMSKLTKQFPQLSFEYKYADEDISYNTGYGETDDEGDLIMNYPQGRSAEAMEIYIECWEEDEDDWVFHEGSWQRKEWIEDEEDEEEEIES